MNNFIVILPSAEDDIKVAYDWYEKQKAGLGDEFILEFEFYADKISLNPFLFPIKHDDYHVCVMNRFPYCIYYFPTEKDVLVWAVLHTSRDIAKATKGKGLRNT